MTKKETFISEIEEIIENVKKTTGKSPLSDDAAAYFNVLKGDGDKEKPAFTEKGKAILEFMQENKDTYNNIFKAKEIGEGMGITSRTAGGAMRKLVTDGYLEKMGENPVSYSLTDLGISIDLSISWQIRKFLI